MRRIVVLFLLGLLGLVGPLAPPAHADTVSDEYAFVAKINELRASKGVGQLSVDAGLTQIPRNWANKMANDGGISHNPSLKDLVTSNWSKLGENVGMGPELNQLFTAFVNSPHHYENLVDPSFTHVGVGVVYRGGTIFTSHEFMTLRGGSSPAPAPAVTAPPVTTATTRRVVVPRPVAPAPTTTTTTAPPPPPPPPPKPSVPDWIRVAATNLRTFDPAALSRR